MRISEFSIQTGVSTHRLRRYESLGLISSDRQPNGYRTFNATAVRSVIFIDMSRNIGFSIDAIREFIPRYVAKKLTPNEMVHAIERKVQEVDELIASKQVQRKMLIDHIAWFNSQKRVSK
jgi:DNA-binding transcriptional MerR regulator